MRIERQEWKTNRARASHCCVLLGGVVVPAAVLAKLRGPKADKIRVVWAWGE